MPRGAAVEVRGGQVAEPGSGVRRHGSGLPAPCGRPPLRRHLMRFPQSGGAGLGPAETGPLQGAGRKGAGGSRREAEGKREPPPATRIGVAEGVGGLRGRC